MTLTLMLKIKSGKKDLPDYGLGKGVLGYQTIVFPEDSKDHEKINGMMHAEETLLDEIIELEWIEGEPQESPY